jgi:hypothetical protein
MKFDFKQEIKIQWNLSNPHTPWKCVGLYRTSEYSGFILVYRNTLGPKVFVSDVTGIKKIQVSDCKSSTVYTKYMLILLVA